MPTPDGHPTVAPVPMTYDPDALLVGRPGDDCGVVLKIPCKGWGCSTCPGHLGCAHVAAARHYGHAGLMT